MSDPFVFFARAVSGHIVTRYGSRQMMGVKADGEGKVEWDETTIHAITEAEMAKYGREYRRAVADGALKPAKREEWDAQRTATKRKAEEAREFFVSVRTKHAEKLEAAFPGRKAADITDDEIFAWSQAGGVPIASAAQAPERPKKSA